MPVEAVAIVKWKKGPNNENEPDRLYNIGSHAEGNWYRDILNISELDIPGKITGNVKNLNAFYMYLSDATWAAHENDVGTYWAWYHQTDADGNVVNSNKGDTLNNPTFNGLVNFLTNAGFDASSLSQSDTREELTNKTVEILKQ